MKRTADREDEPMIDETYDPYQMAEIDAATWEQAQDGETVAVEIDDTDAPF